MNSSRKSGRISGKINDFCQHHYYIVYSFIFIILALIVFCYFFMNGKSFIYESDGWNQHFKALVYYAKWLRSIIRNFLTEHTLEIPTFSFSIGYGSDILTTLHYYVIGDPLNLLSVFVPTKYMAYFYSALVVLRFYLAGITFSKYCFYRKNEDQTLSGSNGYGRTAILAGALLYTFCGFALFGGIRHPYFMNPMIYFPLVLMGVEKILHKKSPVLFVLSVFLSAVSNFYFFYMIAILTVLYVIWRLVVLHQKGQFKKTLGCFGKIAGYSVLGTALGAAVFLPVVLSFFSSGRLENNTSYDFLYNISAYESDIGGFLSSSLHKNWTVMGYGAVALIALIVLFIQKKHNDIKAAFLVLTVMLLIPAVGSFMNGFSYATNRWVWGYSFLIAFIVVLKWDSLFSLTKKEKLILCAGLSVYLVLCIILEKSRTSDVMFALAVSFLALAVISMSGDSYRIKTGNALLILCVITGIAGNALFLYSPEENDYVANYIDYDGIENKLEHTEEAAVKTVANEDSDGFFRYAGSTTTNGSLLSGLHSTQYYWSLEDGVISRFREEMGMPNDQSRENYSGMDSRTILSALGNVQYYLQGSKIPYGYSHVNTISNYANAEDYLESNYPNSEYAESDLTDEDRSLVDKNISTYQVWENDYFLPFGYTYSSYITEEDYENMTPLEKQEALLQGCVVQEEYCEGEEAEVSFTGKSLEYEMTYGKNISIEGNVITVKKNNTSITMTFDGMENAETYLYITGLNYEGIEPVDRYTDLEWELLSKYEQNDVLNSQKYYNGPEQLTLSLSAKNSENQETTSSIFFTTPEFTFYSNRENFMANMGYDENKKTSITIKFNKKGKYSFDTLEVLCQPLDQYPDQISALSEDVLEKVDFYDDNTAFATNQVSGEINLDSPKYLLLSIPYSDGWSAYVDGEEQELIPANRMYTALYLVEGEHEILLVYHTPGLRAGILISLSSLIIFLLILFVGHKTDRPRRMHASGENYDDSGLIWIE